jgi:hypothetical protein
MDEQEYVDALDQLCIRSGRLVKALTSWDMVTTNSVAHIYTQAIAVAIGHSIARITEEYFELSKGSIIGGMQYKNG